MNRRQSINLSYPLSGTNCGCSAVAGAVPVAVPAALMNHGLVPAGFQCVADSLPAHRKTRSAGNASSAANAVCRRIEFRGARVAPFHLHLNESSTVYQSILYPVRNVADHATSYQQLPERDHASKNERKNKGQAEEVQIPAVRHGYVFH